MPISKEHKAVFIHIPKTGGGSIEKALGIYGINNKGSNIHCTKIFYGYREVTADSMEEFKDNCSGQNYKHCCNRGLRKNIKKYIFKPVYNEEHSLQHATISEIKRKKSIRSYYSFTFVRNPFDRLVSEYEWRKSNHENVAQDFKSFVTDFVSMNIDSDRHLMSQHKFITNKKKKLLVDFVGQYEDLNNDYKVIANKLNLKSGLPGLHRSNKTNYKEYYDKNTIQLVSRLYKTDLEIFNYKF